MPAWLAALLILVPPHLQGLGTGLRLEGFCGSLLTSRSLALYGGYGGTTEAGWVQLFFLAGLILQGGLGYALLLVLLLDRESLNRPFLRVSGGLMLTLGVAYLVTRTLGFPLPSPYGPLLSGPLPGDGLGYFLALWEILAGVLCLGSRRVTVGQNPPEPGP